MARLLRAVTTPTCLLPNSIVMKCWNVVGASLARQMATGLCDLSPASRPCLTSHLALSRRTCHSGPTQTVFPEDGLSCNNSNVTWLFPASGTMERLVAAGKHSILNTITCLTLSSAQPIPVSAFEEMMHHLTRKVPSLRTCFRQHKNKLWVCELHKPKIDFQVAGDDFEAVISSMLNRTYNHEEGPMWCARLFHDLSTDPNPSLWSLPEPRSTFRNQYHLMLGFHHAANDGLSMTVIDNVAERLLQDVINSAHIDDSQVGHLMDPTLTMNLEQSVREKLEEDPLQLSTMLKEMSVTNKSFTPLLSEAFSDPVVTQPKSKSLHALIDGSTMESFQNKCKTVGISLTCGLSSVLDRAMVELVREAGVQRDLYSVTSRQAVSERRYISSGNPFTEMGCFLGVLPHTVIGSHRDRKDFWQYAKLSGQQFQEELKQKLVYKDRILRALLHSKDDNFSYDSYYATQPPLICDYFLSTLVGSHYKNFHASKHCRSLKTTAFRLYNNIHRVEYSNIHAIVQFHDKHIHNLIYSTGRITDEVAERMQQMFLKTLRDMTL